MMGLVTILSKKGNGEGSIRKRKDGTWEARYTVGYNENGKQVQKSLYGKTRQEVQKKLTKINASRDNGSYIEPNKVLLSEWLIYWLKNYVQNKLKPSTYASYQTYIYKHINPLIGKLYLRKISTNDLQLFFNKKHKSGRLNGKGGLSSKTMRNMYNMFHEALQQAEINRLINNNPINGVILPKMQKNKMQIFSEAEITKICNCSKSERLGFAIPFVFKTGLRIGEVCALKWSDFNFEDRTFEVSRTLQRVQKKKSELKDGEPKTYIHEGNTKTQNSNRVIPLSPKIYEQLLQYKEKQKEEKALLGMELKNNDYVFSNEFGRFIEPSYLRKVYNRILDKAEVNHLKFHCMRHTYATLMIEKGVAVKTVSEILGHGCVEVTMNLYCHPSIDAKRKAVNDLDKFLDF